MFAPDDKRGKLKLVASNDARDGSLKINQDVWVFDSILNEGEAVSYDLTEKRYGFLQVVKGSLELNVKLCGRATALQSVQKNC